MTQRTQIRNGHERAARAVWRALVTRLHVDALGRRNELEREREALEEGEALPPLRVRDAGDEAPGGPAGHRRLAELDAEVAAAAVGPELRVQLAEDEGDVLGDVVGREGDAEAAVLEGGLDCLVSLLRENEGGGWGEGSLSGENVAIAPNAGHDGT